MPRPPEAVTPRRPELARLRGPVRLSGVWTPPRWEGGSTFNVRLEGVCADGVRCARLLLLPFGVSAMVSIDDVRSRCVYLHVWSRGRRRGALAQVRLLLHGDERLVRFSAASSSRKNQSRFVDYMRG